MTVTATMVSGGLGLILSGWDGTEYYRNRNIPTTTFEIPVDLGENEKLIFYVTARKHSGGFEIVWE